MATEQAAPPTAIAIVSRPSDRRLIEAGCRRLGLQLGPVLRPADPPGPESLAAQGLDAVAEGRAGCLVVRRLADLDRPPGTLPALLDRVEAEGLRVVALDVGLDTADPTGRLALRRRVAPRSAAALSRCIGYVCAERGQAARGEELGALRDVIADGCEQHGLELVEVVGDREPQRRGKALERPGLAHALGRLASGEAACLVVARLDHLSRTAGDLGDVLAWLDAHDVRLIALDHELDTGTDSGRTAARALVSVGGWERERLSERTRAGLRAAGERRRAGEGGEAALRARIAAMRADGMTLQAIADTLNAEGVPTLRGGTCWRPSSVQSAAGYRRPA